MGITSDKNPRLKQLKQLVSSARARRQAGLIILEGVHLTTDYLATVGQPLECYLSESSLDNKEAQVIIDSLSHLVSLVTLPDNLFKTVSTVENGIGLLFVAPTPKNTPPVSLSQPAVLLDDIQDPGNVGTILRTAAAAGVTDIYCSSGTASAWSPKVLRAGMGAQFTVKIYEAVDLVELLKSSALPVFATSLTASSSLYDADLNRPTAWLFGSEGQGVSGELLSLVSDQVIIPQSTGVESLNVAASVAICLFEQRRQQTSRM